MAQELISAQGLRTDGRRQNELRNISIKLGVLDRCDGSSFVQHGNTKVIASISGPKNPDRKASSKKDENFYFNVRVKFATFSKNGERQKPIKNSKKNIEFELNLRNIFKSVILVEKYEKSQLDLNIEILQTDGGSEICAAVNAATLALIDAGICLREYVCACTASLTNDGQIPLLDVSHLEEISGGPTLTVAALPRVGDHQQSVSFVELSQKFYLKDFNKIFECALKGCERIRAILDEAIRANANETAVPQLTEN